MSVRLVLIVGENAIVRWKNVTVRIVMLKRYGFLRKYVSVRL